MRVKTGGLAGAALLAGAIVVGVSVADAATVRSELNLRAGPGTGYGVVAVMPAGAEVDVRGCSGAWCRVAWGSAEGYAHADYLIDDRDDADAPPPAAWAGFQFRRQHLELRCERRSRLVPSPGLGHRPWCVSPGSQLVALKRRCAPATDRAAAVLAATGRAALPC